MHIIGVIVEGLRQWQCRRLAVATQIDAQYRESPAQFGSYRLEEREIKPTACNSTTCGPVPSIL